MIWWEKTVEYMFVQNMSGKPMAISALDGNFEKAADVILADYNQWLLIEFKRYEESIIEEKPKFVDYEAAQKDFYAKERCDKHHIIVYGKEENQALELKAQTHFTEDPFEDATLKTLRVNGTTKFEFKDYMEWFLSHKKETRRFGGGSRLHFEDYMMAAAITASDNEVGSGKFICITLEEYCKTFDITHKLDNEPDNSSYNDHVPT